MQRTHISTLVIALLTLLILNSCGGAKKESQLPPITGEPGQILVVAAKDLSQTPIADTLQTILGEEFPCIPQSEPSFDLIYGPDNKFTGVLRQFRNILRLQIKDTTIAFSRNADNSWADPQAVLYIAGPSYESINQYIDQNRYKVAQFFIQAERDRLKHNYSEHPNKEIRRFIKNKFDVTLDIPASMSARVDTTDFTWVSLETPDISQGIIVYKIPNHGGLYSADSLIKFRNSFTKAYIPGPLKGTYMKVTTLLPPETQLLRFGQDTLMRMRGLWDVEGYSMGGAFISYARVSKDRKSIIVTDGYIYAPRFKKREYVRQLDAILLSQTYREKK